MIDAAGLRVMKAIADEGSFTGAAASLGYTQPAISQMVRRLEQRTGTVLVDRVGRQVRLTEAGQVLARHAVSVLSALDAAEEEVAAIAGLRAGRVRMTSFPSATATLVPRALANVHRDHPDLSVTFTEAEPPEALAALRAGETDLVIAFRYEGGASEVEDSDFEGLVTVPLLTDEVRVVLAKDHPMADLAVVPLDKLATDPWIAGCPRCRIHLLSMAADAGFRPTVSFEIEDYVAQIGLVGAGLGVALVPDLIVKTAAGDEVVVRTSTPGSRRQVVAVTTPDLQKVPAVAATIEALQASADAFVAS
ncbi:LysR family transcriptional regulator [Arsenicicoccus piscis]|uniref:LysR family transcriptional regulator n=1 Tax=Arsenicicoccus piscis TaxID=673954 RepID=A0ABQ6HK81_9MICO|nr:LysR family transcriptional regulator [Arsenicicoccus piscis]MCH8627193.1 LysR family transcriptional regulator [Arsenicicoccus piscis]GMA18838.1 LysR family transcriptional regulator [Arsenicicoccus piscis]